jgi:hypothetical protein
MTARTENFDLELIFFLIAEVVMIFMSAPFSEWWIPVPTLGTGNAVRVRKFAAPDGMRHGVRRSLFQFPSIVTGPSRSLSFRLKITEAMEARLSLSITSRAVGREELDFLPMLAIGAPLHAFGSHLFPLLERYAESFRRNLLNSYDAPH